MTDPAEIEALVERLEDRWERMGTTAAPKINRILLERKQAATALRGLLADNADIKRAMRFGTELTNFASKQVVSLEGQLTQARADLAFAAKHLRHANNCPYHGGHDCLCGYDEFLAKHKGAE